MQNVAAEMNLSETAFLYPDGDIYNLRWFTPRVEVEMCGHATLASSHVLWEEEYVEENQQICFGTKSGILKATKAGDWIELDFPAIELKPNDYSSQLVEALGATPTGVCQCRLDALVELESAAAVRQLEPDITALEKALGFRGVMVTARDESGEYDFISRFFAPSVGIPEDPVTGSAHCALAPYWKERLGKSEFMAYQASERGGDVRLRIEGDRVILGGKAVTILHGELTE